MRILKIQTLRGPNYWSIRRHKLIVMRLDLENLAETPSNEIPGFYEGLVDTLPSLEGHYCSPGCHGGFLMRVREGTMMGHIVEHVALELQDLAGMNVGFGRTRETGTPGIYQVAIEYLNEEAGRYAARAAVRLCQSIVDRGRYPKAELEQDLQDLKDLWRDAALGPSTEAIVKEAEKRGIPWTSLGARFLIQLGYGVNQKRLQATMTDNTGILGVELACDKEATKRILANGGVPVPKGTTINFLDDLQEAIEYVGGYPIVIKPLDGNHGRGITIDIRTWEEAQTAYDAARQISRAIIVERYYVGRDHRVLVVDGKVVAVAERVPAHVTGNGRSTIFELIEETNNDPNRGEGHDNVLTKIELDRTSYQLLERQGYTLSTVLQKGEICYLRATANLSTGGIAVDRTDEIHPENLWLAQRVVKIIGLDIAGIDIVTSDISRPLREVDGVIVEVNAAPGFRMHIAPSIGIPRNVAGAVIDMLFANEQASRIPILSVTGTNGKTTTTRLLAHIFKQTNKVVGYTTTDGTYIGDFLVEAGDNTGPQSAQLILQDPTVEVAVLETARGGLLRSGLAFESANVGVVLNVSADHLGIGDIDTIEQLAHLKSIVAEAVFPDGYAVLNADDPRVAAMAEKTKANIAYFTMNPDAELVRNHIQKGGVVAVYENGYLSIVKGDWTHRIERAENIPLTMGGRAPFMIANALAASLAAFVQNVSIEQIRAGLNTFRASVSQTPGRMNLFNLGNYHALVDYAHNPASYEALGGFVRNWTGGQRIGVIGGPGDRRDQDFVTLGKLAAEIFDYIIIKEDDDTRGRQRGSAAELITQGIKQVNANSTYETILQEAEAIKKGLDIAPDNSLVVILPESVSRAIKLIKDRGTVKEELHQQNSAAPIVDSPLGVKSSVANTI
ncbi:cyanophycin synthetase [Aetokthonos hydrillicola Thurmond2011]|uniref:Cyanophycin synthetase n=1 Tax=Aetokthonos hydrillicola Thurmond2011 TaxID=2712845 RepID=A0AAP5M9D0_9CYAN|nr:cyanophycin synthetase [Aetokthonos hydrillicola]MBO3460865.1 cyanophycin synthetase [Aetokthonos hydrillicola CCALA 1050]MBW4585658.1 cyanophycin synthetase [Aetokthonos hydrillicola CCALA 1050]MDR9894558.1 cyanophycin synthetase [Aetokthonos hydrillicola Thurmond2011]